MNDRFEYLHVAGAAAKIAGEPVANVCFTRLRIAFEQIDSREDHPWSTNTTLRAAVVDKSLLHRVQLISIRDAFNRHDLRTVDLSNRH